MKLTKTAALKGALLMVLAANMSWDRISFESMNLASTGSPEVVGSTANVTATAAAPTPVQETPAHHTAAALKVSQPDAATPVKVSQPEHSATLQMCGEAYAVHYQQFEERGVTMTRVSARKATNPQDKWDVAVILRSDLIETISEKESAHRILATNVKEYRAKRKEACGQEVVAANAAKKEEVKAEQDEEKKRLADGMKKCEIDSKGQDIKRDERLSCFVEQLSRIDKNLDKKGADGKRLSEEALARAAQSELQRLHREVKRLAKTDLLSKDESRADEAKELLVTAMDAIEDVAATYGLGVNPRTGRTNNSVSKLIGELSALKHAGETNERSKEYVESAQSVRDNMRQSFESALRNPLDPYANYALQAARAEYQALQQDIGMNFEPQYMSPLNNYKRAGLISGAEFTEFTRSFSDIQRLMKEAISTGTNQPADRTRPTGTITGSVLGSDYVLPANLAALRSQGTTASTSRILGTTIPSAAPVINLPSIPNQTLTPPRSIFGN